MNMATTNITAIKPQKQRLPNMNRLVLARMAEAANTLQELNRRGIEVLELDVNRVKPVFLVAACAATRALNGTCYMRKCEHGQQLFRKQALVGNCRVEWNETITY